ncbi:hemin uptake protein HemP [Szabonella alba]|uniref:Hemin uptake protein HemP n=1 Tax=Szabonella alba TaxID=2804194 RepID=A0A8K0Y1D8_9RHOB|nr:hemin uptake protein HemP [Szabonella alba]MBL4918033.1 hemin uptake protein HemP [Szabonella alba]
MTHSHPDTAPALPTSANPQVHDALDLTAGGATALIRMNDQTWTLRITRQGKLILTK